ncbi:MAG TPA: GIY-YIG nuclease family protein [Burkholderiales bacterium]|nr:GIY-YIG nuclease family protein [Burkholderiales bacterium]
MSARRKPPPGPDPWWLYVLECQGGILYTGIAKDVDARFAAHHAGTGAIFTRLNRPLRILAKVTLPTRSAALRAEYAFKQTSRVDKRRWCATGLERFVAAHHDARS